MEPTLKQRLKTYYQEMESDFDPEETVNVLEILQGYDDSLTNLGKWDKAILLRMIDDPELYEEINEIDNEEETTF